MNLFRFSFVALIVISLVGVMVPAASAAGQLTIAQVEQACAPFGCTADEFQVQTDGSINFRMFGQDQGTADQRCLDFRFDGQPVKFWVAVGAGRSWNGQVYPGYVAHLEHVCQAVFNYSSAKFTNQLSQTQLFCRPAVACSAEHFMVEGSLIHYDHPLTGGCPTFVIPQGVFFQFGGEVDPGPMRVTQCELRIGGAPVIPTFSDQSYSGEVGQAVQSLVLRGVVRGDGGVFGPNDSVLRSQMAAMIARAMGWDLENHGNQFSDQGRVDADLWRNVGTLAYYGVAHGYGDGTFGPTQQVDQAQVISFITRAMESTGCWRELPDTGGMYPNVPGSSGHRLDLATYTAYVGSLNPDGNAFHAFVGWDQPATRAWTALVLERALDSECGKYR